MGVLAPIGAAIGSIFGAGTVGALGTAATIASGALAAKSLLTGAPKSPTIAAPAPAPAPIIAPPQASPIKPITSSTNSSLAALSPGLALGGTGGFLGAGQGGAKKTLLGQ